MKHIIFAFVFLSLGKAYAGDYCLAQMIGNHVGTRYEYLVNCQDGSNTHTDVAIVHGLANSAFEKVNADLGLQLVHLMYQKDYALLKSFPNVWRDEDSAQEGMFRHVYRSNSSAKKNDVCLVDRVPRNAPIWDDVRGTYKYKIQCRNKVVTTLVTTDRESSVQGLTDFAKSIGYGNPQYLIQNTSGKEESVLLIEKL